MKNFSSYSMNIDLKSQLYSGWKARLIIHPQTKHADLWLNHLLHVYFPVPIEARTFIFRLIELFRQMDWVVHILILEYCILSVTGKKSAILKEIFCRSSNLKCSVKKIHWNLLSIGTDLALQSVLGFLWVTVFQRLPLCWCVPSAHVDLRPAFLPPSRKDVSYFCLLSCHSPPSSSQILPSILSWWLRCIGKHQGQRHSAHWQGS